jgi:hypothetical protein
MRRNTGSRFANSEEWILGQGDLQRYHTDDTGGIRNFSGDERQSAYHASRDLPAFPILGHGQLIWMFRKSSDVSADSWDITEVGSGTQLALQDEMGGVAKAITGSADDNNQRYFSKAECMQIPTLAVITFKTRIRILEPVQCDAFIGFCEKGVNIISGRQNAVGFYLDDASALIRVETNSGGSSEQEASTVTLVADQWVELAMGIHCNEIWSTKHVNFFINGAFVAEHRTNIPTAAMALAFGIQNGEAVANELSITTTVLLKD